MADTGGRRAAVTLALLLVFVLTGCSVPSSAFSPDPRLSEVVDAGSSGIDARMVSDAFSTRDVLGHLDALQRIADANGGNRAAGTSGYEESARYVEEQLRAAGYDTVRQSFSYRDHRDARVETFTVLADTGGNALNTVVVGGHLDSVRRGPGINDNGSGVAALLETALWFAEDGMEPTNRVRFAFWGGEEDGLHGSEHYVEELSTSELDGVMLNLNVDMAASPNGARFVHDGDGSVVGRGGPAGSEIIEETFLRYFDQSGLPAEFTPLDGESDYAAFADAGIPVGGLFTGDDEAKTVDQAKHYGGTAGRAFDSCYHESCDTIENVDSELLRDMAGALAFATATFAEVHRSE
ncbi:M20/M25/M40 family metallo-hydrolase [Planctomonas psychrotolerans]|uniref:M20/M25/M40 family metallo-hydrolase n=1 Tax=Planctomonas psychrotolerans TaxID=2528712 RepID=UPI001239F31C|nr:M20/M25/M40 family metallo-hydrolase [Planctomonas psychrotolerans]